MILLWELSYPTVYKQSLFLWLVVTNSPLSIVCLRYCRKPSNFLCRIVLGLYALYEKHILKLIGSTAAILRLVNLPDFLEVLDFLQYRLIRTGLFCAVGSMKCSV